LFDYQPTLLAFLLQDSISHAALFVGLVVGLFTFLNFAFPSGSGGLARAIGGQPFFTWVVLDILLSATIYVSGRSILYGQLLYQTVRIGVTPANQTSFAAYYDHIVVAASKTDLGQLFRYYGTLFDLGLSTSVLVGGILAVVIYNQYGKKPWDTMNWTLHIMLWIGLGSTYIAFYVYLNIWTKLAPLPSGIAPLVVFYGLIVPWAYEISMKLALSKKWIWTRIRERREVRVKA
jgi:hypothetical protein